MTVLANIVLAGYVIYEAKDIMAATIWILTELIL